MIGGSRPSLVTTHARALHLLEHKPDLRVSQLAEQLQVTSRTAQRIVGELEELGLLRRSRIGRRNHYRVTQLPWLRHAVAHDELLNRRTAEDQADSA